MIKSTDDTTLGDAMSAWERGDLKAAHALFEEGAKRGDTSCQLNFGVFLESGLGGRQSLDEALKWYKRAFRGGCKGAAASNIADAYSKMNNTARAEFWFRRAVALGDGDAALEYAEYIAALGRHGNDKRIRNLLKQAIASSNITPVSREKAETWLAAISSS